MKTLDLSTPPGKLTRQGKQAAVEAKLREIQDAATGLLQEVGIVDPFVAETLRDESARLAGIGFTLVQLLLHDQLERAYQIASGEPDEFGEVLGVAV